MGEQQRRTGLFTSRYEARLESLPDIKGQTTELFSRLAREMHATLVKATDDKRQYRAVIEVRMVVLVDPDQAQVGDEVFWDGDFRDDWTPPEDYQFEELKLGVRRRIE